MRASQAEVASSAVAHGEGSRSRPATAPLSSSQRRIWFLEQLGPEKPAFQLGAAIRLEGGLRVVALRKALATLVARHRILGATFGGAGQEPCQRIGAPRPFELEVVELVSASARPEKVAGQIAAEMLRPFDLARGPMLRASLIQLRAADPILVVSVHELACDRPSLDRLLRELAALHKAFATGGPPPGEDPTPQYADFTLREREELAGDALERRIAFWSRRLRGAPTALQLPTDRPRPGVQTFAGARRRLRLPEGPAAAVSGLCRRRDVEPWIFVLAAFKALLFRASGAREILVGWPVDGRDPSEALIGPFTNPLVLRTTLAGDLRFQDLLDRVRETVSEALAHKDLPFGRLLEALNVEPDLSHHPLFQVLFLCDDAPSEIDLPGRRWIPLEIAVPTTQVDLSVRLTGAGDRLTGWLEYNPDLFDATTIGRLASHLVTLIEHAAAEPEQSLAALRILPRSQRHQVLREWSLPPGEGAAGECFHELFESWAAAAPEAIALTFAQEAWSYRHLGREADRVARKLRALGIGPEARVGICLDRGPAMIGALLGVLKAGGAYVPLDPTYPQERLAFMLQDSGVALLLTESRLLAGLPAYPGRTLCLDSDRWRRPGPRRSRSGTEVGPDHLAYVMYTSGSTGRPKGSLTIHRGLGNVVRAQRRTFGVGPGDRVLQLAALSYDASIWEVVMALGAGASLHLAPADELYPGPGLHRMLRERRIRHLTIAPTALAALPDRPLPALGTLIVAGEELRPALARRWARGRRLFNAYGPTEATIWATVAPCPAHDSGKPSIGRPVAALDAYLVDRRLRPVAVGSSGELLLGGSGLARGYLRSPASTAVSFVPDPFGHRPGRRLYRTGDLARHLPDGRIQFLGRLDAQVKVRGFRIELGEIESVLGEHPAVRECVVLAREDEPGRKRLVAYVALAADGEHGVSELRSFLRPKLPDFMVPATWVILDQLPVLPNGKIDRRALPPPREVRAGAAAGLDPPRTGPERRLAEIWAQVLGVERVGRSEDFFHLGGDSILAMRLIARARRAGLRLTPGQIFRHPTVAEQAAVAGRVGEETERSVVVGEVALSPIQHWFFERNLPHPEHWNQAVLLEVRPPLRGAPWRRICRHLMTHHDALRLRFAETGSGWRQWIAPPEVAVPASRVDLSALARPAQGARLRAAAGAVQGSLRLRDGPVFRAVHFDLGPRRPGRLLLVVHHLAVDGVSWRILLEDLEAVLRQIRRGETVTLPPRTDSVQRRGAQLREAGRALPVAREAARWLALAGTGAARLPQDGPGGANSEGSARTLSVSLGAEETRRLLSGRRAAGARPAERMLTALVETLARWAGVRSIRLDLEGHGRDRLGEEGDLTRTVGWLTALHPLAVSLPNGSDPGAVLESVRRQLRAVPNGLGYGLSRYLALDRAPPEAAEQLRALPPADAVFNYLGRFDPPDGAALPWSREPVGPLRHPLNPRRHLLEVTALVLDGRLRVLWTYSRNRHRRSSVVRLARHFRRRLRELLPAGPAASALGTERRPPLGADPDAEDVYPLSPLQQGMLYHSRAAPPGTGIYVEQFCLTLRGTLDVGAFRRAWQHLTDRHPVLRTAFCWQGVDNPLQVVSHRVEVDWVDIDWRRLREEEQEAQLESLLLADRRRGFVLSRAPLTRLALISRTEATWQLVWSYHHIILDGWSIGGLMNELLTLHEEVSRGREPDLAPAPCYRDYVAWTAGLDEERARGFWRRTLRGLAAPTSLGLAGDAGASRAKGTGFGDLEIRLPAAASDALRQAARRHRLTLNTLVQASWAILLRDYSGDGDVVFGVTLSTRPAELAGVESMVGLLLNTLPLRVRLPHGARLLPWLQALQAHQLDLQRFARSPLVDVQRWSDVPGGLPLFESILVFESYPFDRTPWERHRAVTIDNLRGYGWTNYPLTVLVVPGSRVSVRIKYDRRRSDEAEITRLLGHLEWLLGRWPRVLAADPQIRLRELARCNSRAPRRPAQAADAPAGPRAGHRSRSAPLATGCDVPFDRRALAGSILRRFAEQAARDPSRLAVESRRHALTYCQLDRAADRLAAAVVASCGDGEGQVAVLCGHDAPAITGFLGTLKAGKAYVPLDPAYPPQRLAWMLADCRAGALVADGENLELAREIAPGGRRVIALERLPEDVPEVRIEVAADRRAYVLYTSGSTGRPKGVMQSHRNVLHHIRAYTESLGIAARDRLALVSSCSFDGAVMDIWGALLNGATLVPIDVLREGPEGLAERLRREQITVYHSTPTVYRALVGSAGAARGFPGIRAVVLGGEELLRQDIDGYRHLFAPECLFVNGLGPTESTLCLQGFFDRGTRLGRRSVSVGHPVADTEVLLLDRTGAPQAIRGEIAIRSRWLAVGYWRRPGLTAASFVPDPEGGGGRVYLTGDLARRLPDGSLEFLGRRDRQVKIRGIRIEPGEIEAMLRQHPSVREAVVRAGADPAGDPRLVAFVVCDRSSEPTPQELRRHLSTRLPRFLVPASFVTLEALPRTPTGKVDRAALSVPEEAVTPEAYVAPRNRIERQLTSIWEQVLRRNPIGVRDDFFDLGGHSFLAVQLFARIEKTFDRTLPLATLFRAPTVAQLAELLRDRGCVVRWPSVVMIRPWGARPPLFCVHGVTGDPFIYRNLAPHLDPDQPLYGFQAPGLSRESPPHTRIEHMAAHYLREMKDIQPRGPYYLGGFCFGGTVAFEIARQLRAAGEEVGLLAVFDTHASITRSLPSRVLLRFALAEMKRYGEHHLGVLRTLPRRSRLTYVSKKGGRRLLRAWNRVRERVSGSDPTRRASPRTSASVIEANRRAARAYSPDFYPGKVTVFRSVGSLGKIFRDPLLGWEVLAARMEIHEIPGLHHSMFDEPNVRLLAEKLRRCLAVEPQE